MYCWFNSPNKTFSFLKGVVDGERPLKCFLSKFWLPGESSDLHLYLTSRNILRAFQKNKFHYEFNPDPEKSQILFSHVFSTRCLFGGSYEMEFPEDAHTKPPRRVTIPSWRLFPIQQVSVVRRVPSAISGRKLRSATRWPSIRGGRRHVNHYKVECVFCLGR